MYGQVEYKVLSLKQLEEEQRRAVEYVEDMLKLKVRCSCDSLARTRAGCLALPSGRRMEWN